jgi:hypothetical protein
VDAEGGTGGESRRGRLELRMSDRRDWDKASKLS